MKKWYIFCLAVLCAELNVNAIDYEHWMGDLPDELTISQVSILGTHDSGTAGFALCGETQKLSIQEQLNGGIRAFDVRAGVYNSSKLLIFHSELLHGDDVDQVFSTLTDFLVTHPSECLFVVLKRECGDKATWNNLMLSCLQKYSTFFVDLHKGLTIGEMRGKILLMSRDKYATNPIGTFFLSGWSDNATSGNHIKGTGVYQMPVRIQDIYDADGRIDEKKADIVKLLDECAASISSFKLFINHTSGYTYTYYLDSRALAECAAACNETVIQHLQEMDGPAGLIMTDFAGKDHLKYGGKTYDVNGQILIDSVIGHCYKVAEKLYPSAVDALAAEVEEHNLPVFDLQGRTIAPDSSHDLFIVNGKKYLVK